jgi:hypothetical protein
MKNAETMKQSSKSEESDFAVLVRTLTVKLMQEAVVLINKGYDICCNSDPNYSGSQPLREDSSQLYSHTISYCQKRQKPDIYFVIYKTVNFLSFS